MSIPPKKSRVRNPESTIRRPGRLATRVLIFAMLAAAAAHEAAGQTYFMERKDTRNRPFTLPMDGFINPPRKSKPFEYKKSYTPERTIQAVSTKTRSSYFSLGTIDSTYRFPTTSFDFVRSIERDILDILSTDRRTKIPPSSTVRDVRHSARTNGRMAVAEGVLLKPSEAAVRAVTRLAEAVSARKGWTIACGGFVPLESAEAPDSPRSTPFSDVLLMVFEASAPFELTKEERSGLLRYLQGGGFLFVDSDPGGFAPAGFETAAKVMDRAGGISRFRIMPLPKDHPLARAFSGIARGPAAPGTGNPPRGIWLGDRLAGLITGEGFLTRWSLAPLTDDSFLAGTELLTFLLSPP